MRFPRSINISGSFGSFGSAVDKKRWNQSLYALSPWSIYLVARLARQCMTKEQTSRLVWGMIKSGPVLYSLPNKTHRVI